ncbi:unnamed protein product [Urochloa humidicola]
MPFSLGNPRPEDRAAFISHPVLLEFPPCVDTDVDASVTAIRTLAELAAAAGAVAESAPEEHDEGEEDSSGDDLVPLVVRQR